MTGAISTLEGAVGDPAAVRAVAGELRRRAGLLTAEAERLSVLSRGEWEGAAAVSFTALVLVLPDELRRSVSASTTASAALEQYADAVATAQSALPGLRERARAASLRYARSGPLGPGPGADASPFGPPDAAALHAEREREEALAELAVVRRDAERLADGVDDAGRAAARALEGARDLLPLPAPLPARAARAAASVVAAAWEDVKAFTVEHNEEIELVADVLSAAGTAALALSVVCPPLAVVAAGTRVASAAATLGRAVGGRRAVALTLTSAGANAAVVAGDEEKTVRDLWPDLLAVGTLGASRVLTTPGRFTPGRFSLPQARAADDRLSAGSGATRPSTWPSPAESPRQLPSIWDPATGLGPNELVARSVRYAVEAPNAVVGTAGGLAAGRRLTDRAAGRPAVPGRGAPARSAPRRARDPEREPA